MTREAAVVLACSECGATLERTRWAWGCPRLHGGMINAAELVRAIAAATGCRLDAAELLLQHLDVEQKHVPLAVAPAKGRRKRVHRQRELW